MAAAIIVFSHLRWDSLFHRPQEIFSRLARHHRIVFFEEPVYTEGEAWLESWEPEPNILVCRPHSNVPVPGFHDDQLPCLQKMLMQAIEGVGEHYAWFHTPMALPLLQQLQPQLVIYDCMDELGAYRHAPRQLQQRENALLCVADIVFVDGRSLYRSKRTRHPNIHFVPSSVDTLHFLPALDRANSHPAHKDIAGPRLGYYGVIDERFDVDLIGRLADAHPMWQIVLVGPISGIDMSTLPRRANLHWLGAQPYQALPHFLAGWDVCLLPFALNDATRYATPAMALAYMAAELPIVSTPVADVVDQYGDIISIAADAPAFVAACESALLATREERERVVGRMRRLLEGQSWDRTVERIRDLIDNTPVRPRDRTLQPIGGAKEDAPNVNRLRRPEPVRYVTDAILGAGPAGLSAAFHLGHDALLLDRNPMVGGHCRSIRKNGFTFDGAEAVVLTQDPYALEMVRMLLGSNFHWQEREVVVCDPQPASSMVRFAYPLRGGMQALMSAFVPHIKGTIELNADIIAISPLNRRLTLADGRRYEYENLISTIPLPSLVRMSGSEAPVVVLEAARALRQEEGRRVLLGIARANINDKLWVDYPEGAMFRRVFMQGNASPDCQPPGAFSLACDLASDVVAADAGGNLIDRCVAECVRLGLLRPDDRVVFAQEVSVMRIEGVPDPENARHAELIRNWFAGHGIVLAGQNALWEGSHADHAFIAGKKAAEMVKWIQPRSVLAAE